MGQESDQFVVLAVDVAEHIDGFRHDSTKCDAVRVSRGCRRERRIGAPRRHGLELIGRGAPTAVTAEIGGHDFMRVTWH